MTHQKLAVVTGGNRGIGLAAVRMLCQRSIKVLFTCRNPHDGQTALMELSTYSRLLDYHPLELTDNDSVATLASYVRSKYGYIDILINNGGVNYDTWQRAKSVSIPEVEYTLDVNLMGAWRMCNAFIPLMLQNNRGRIINVSSGAGIITNQDGSTPGYSISKAALNVLTKCLGSDLADTGVSVNGVDPGWVRTDMGGENAPKSAEEGADTLVWLAIDADSSLTGKFFRNRKEISWY